MNYEIYGYDGGRLYRITNRSGVTIAYGMSWRTARKVCDLLNADRERRQVKP